MFRGEVLDGLRRAHDEGKLHFDGPAASFEDRDRFRRLGDRLQKIRWVAYCKPPFGDHTQVFRYLGQYTHRVGLSNHRLVAFDGHDVTCRTRGQARATLDVDEFLRRFVLHVLPKGFVKIRHHGLFAAGNVPTKLALARARLAATSPAPPDPPPADAAPRDFRELLLALTGVDLRHCARCGALALVRVPLEPPTVLGATTRPSSASTSPPPYTS